MGKNIAIVPLLILFILPMLHAEYRLNFFVGDVRVEVNGKSLEPRTGMIVPSNAFIITGPRSQAHLYDPGSGVTSSIQPGQKASIASLTGGKGVARHSLWDRLKKENRTGGITTSAGVRGAEEGSVEMEWDDGGSSAHLKNRDAEWKLFGERQYAKIIPLTKNASDDDGVFLHAASTYYLIGNSAAEKVTPTLEKIISGGAGSGIRTESSKILAAICFEQARFDRSWDYMSAVAKGLPESEIGETGYFIMAQSAFYTNRSDEGREHLRKMKKYHGRSPLLEKIVER
jgi:hypothetical protein